MDKLKIELLADHPEALPILKELFESEWGPYYGETGPGEAEVDLKESANRSVLPIAQVAVVEGNICGTAALKMSSVTIYPDYFPWLAGLLVDPAYRRQGIGERLISATENLAKQLGFEEIYIGTGEKSGVSETVLTTRKWELISKSEYFVSEVKVFKKSL
ncbi:MAG: GNAT family N-acetyltransferase [Gammaproteobacteria bacterium]